MHILLSCTMYYKVLLKTFSESQSSFFLPKALCHSPLVSSTASVLFSILLKDCVQAALTLPYLYISLIFNIPDTSNSVKNILKMLNLYYEAVQLLHERTSQH